MTLAKVERLLKQAYTVHGSRPISTIEAPEVLVVLRKAEARDRRETARGLRSTIGAVFQYAIATARANTDPTYPTDKRHERARGQLVPAASEKFQLEFLSLPTGALAREATRWLNHQL
jgi:hypothetical protein